MKWYMFDKISITWSNGIWQYRNWMLRVLHCKFFADFVIYYLYCAYSDNAAYFPKWAFRIFSSITILSILHKPHRSILFNENKIIEHKFHTMSMFHSYLLNFLSFGLAYFLANKTVCTTANILKVMGNEFNRTGHIQFHIHHCYLSGSQTFIISNYDCL